MDPRRPGQFLEERIERKALILGAGIALTWILALLGARYWPLALAVIPLVLFLDRQLRDGRRLDPVRELHGLEGERIVGELLDGLARKGVLVVHDLDLGRGNIDHVAITMHGVFAIEVKHLQGGRFHLRKGNVLMQGNRNADGYAKQARRGASLVREALVAEGVEDIWVQPVLVSSRAEVWKDGFRVGKVEVVPAAGLGRVLLSGPIRIDQAQQMRIRAALLQHGPGRTAFSA
jgi:hypothetical protein